LVDQVPISSTASGLFDDKFKCSCSANTVVWYILDLSTLTGLDFSILVGLAPYVLIFGGIVAVSKLLSFFIKGSAGKVLKG
jgi:hypothetical protein